jgi:hypothetical protein
MFLGIAKVIGIKPLPARRLRPGVLDVDGGDPITGKGAVSASGVMLMSSPPL